MVDFAIFYVNEFAEYGAAIALLADAIEIRPLEFDFNAVYAEVLMLAGRFGEARALIERIEGNDRWNDYYATPAGRLSDLQRQLRAGPAAP
jgi:hypothetical protein